MTHFEYNDRQFDKQLSLGFCYTMNPVLNYDWMIEGFYYITHMIGKRFYGVFLYYGLGTITYC